MQAECVDRFSRQRSVIHRADARVKMLATAGLIAATVAMPLRWWPAYLLLAAIALAIYAVAELKWRYLLARLGVALPFLIVIAAGVPLSHGLVRGFDTAAQIVMRALLCLVFTISMVATTPWSELLAALAWFRVPQILIWVLAFMYRYMFVMASELERMRRAKLARSFRPSVGMELRLMGYFVGVLFVRAFERAERVYAAMCARGWSTDKLIGED